MREARMREARTGNASLPQRLLETMRSGLPACTGCALGFDRLLMLACGAESIAQVMACLE
jgi:elongation factor P--(R)-beta-lysine ligase